MNDNINSEPQFSKNNFLLKNHKVSVILTVLNEAKGITTLMDAFLCQSLEPDEIIIADGGSVDGTLNILKEYAKRDNRVRLIEAPGANISRGRNIAIQKAHYSIIAVTDGGCIPSKEWLLELIAPIVKDNTVCAVAGAFEIEWHNRFEFFSGLLCIPKDSGNEQTRMFYGRSSAFLKEVWSLAGGYPEWLYTGEDTLFAFRVQQLGCKIAYAPSSKVIWRPRPTFRKLAKMFFLYGRGNGRICLGNMRGTWYWLRYHTLWIASLLFGFVYPLLWILTIITLCYLYFIMISPVLNDVRKKIDDLWREIYVPLIIMTRNISTTLGYLLGFLEYHLKTDFRKKLNQYLSGL